jgi:hypothetical protein
MAAEVVDRETGETYPSGSTEPADFPDVRLDKRFVQMRSGRQFVAYPGLLDLLHQLSEGFFSVDTEVVQLPDASNGMVAVCQARVRIFDPQDADVVKRSTTGIGDASPDNVSNQMRPHLIRMAETRAKARALRDAVNVGVASLEELGPEEPSERQPAPPRGLSREDALGIVPEAERGIVIEGKRYTRPQIEQAWRQRRAEAERLGIALPSDVATLVAEQAPLPVLVGATQSLKRLVEATQAGQR